jgi:hypothetical protein
MERVDLVNDVHHFHRGQLFGAAATQTARMRRKSCSEASFLPICTVEAPRNALFG